MIDLFFLLLNPILNRTTEGLKRRHVLVLAADLGRDEGIRDGKNLAVAVGYRDELLHELHLAFSLLDNWQIGIRQMVARRSFPFLNEFLRKFFSSETMRTYQETPSWNFHYPFVVKRFHLFSPYSPNHRQSPRNPARPGSGIVDKAIASEVGQTARHHIAVKVGELRQLEGSLIRIVEHGVVDSGLLRGALAGHREFVAAQVRGCRVGGAGEGLTIGECELFLVAH